MSAAAARKVEVRKRWAFILFFALLLSAFPLPGCASFPPGTTDEYEKVYRQQKSVVVGELLAIFPGILVHGIGHWYAGDTKEARDLLDREGLGLIAMGAGVGMWYWGESVDEDYLEIQNKVAAGIFGAVGGALFLESWVTDMAKTPKKVREYNRKLWDRYFPTDEP
jgi:hypothetical protein